MNTKTMPWKELLIGAAILTTALMPSMVHAANSWSYDLEKTLQEYLFVTDANQNGLDLQDTEFTIEAWIKPESVVLDEPMDLVSKDSSSDRGYAFYIDSTGELALFFVASDDTYSQFETEVSTIEGVWQHVAVVVRPSIPSAEFYVNGEFATSTVTSSNATDVRDNVVDFRVGGSRIGEAYFYDGLIDDVRVWSVARTQSQIQNAMNRRVNGSQQPDLIGNWRFDKQNLRDSSLQNNHLNTTKGFVADLPYE